MPEGEARVEGEQIVMLPSNKGNNCFIMLINIFVRNVKKKRTLINAVSLFQLHYCEYKYNRRFQQ